jgi:hypothetical protein
MKRDVFSRTALRHYNTLCAGKTRFWGGEMKNWRMQIARVFGTLVLTTGFSYADELATSLIGTWQLVSYQHEQSDGSVVELYGQSPRGVLIYDETGHMSVHIVKRNLPKCGTIDRRKCSDAKARIAFDAYVGYWGRYEVKAAQSSVFHHVEGASWPDFIGISQKRFIAVSGDRLTITTPPMQIGGLERVGVLVWERVK